MSKVPVIALSDTSIAEELREIARLSNIAGCLSTSMSETEFIEVIRDTVSCEKNSLAARILLVLDDQKFGGELRNGLENSHWQVETVAADSELAKLSDRDYSAAVISLNFSGKKGEEIFNSFRKMRPDCLCLIITDSICPELHLSLTLRGAAGVCSSQKAEEVIKLLKLAIREKAVITLQNRIEEKTLEWSKSEERFFRAMEATKDGIWDWDLVSGEAYFSPGYVAMLGFDRNEVPQTLDFWMDRVHSDDKAAVTQANRDCAEGRMDSFEVEFRMQAKNGEWRWIFGRGKTVSRNEEGKVTRIVGTHVDITAHRRNEEALRESEWRFQKLLAMIPDMISIHDPEMNIVYSNWKGFAAVPKEKRVRYTKCYRTYRGYQEICPDCCAKSVLDSRKEFQEEIQMPDGKWVDLRIIPFLDANGNVELFVEWVRDITGRKVSEGELRKSESRYRRYVDGAPNGIFVADENGRYLEVNRAACRLTGYTRKELMSMSISDITCREDLETALQHFHKARTFGQASGEISLLAKSGGKRYCRIDAVKLSDTRYLGFTTDLTDLKLAQDEIRMAHQTYMGIIDSVSESIYIQAENGIFLDVNDAATKFYGYSREEIIGKLPDFLAAPGRNDNRILNEKFLKALNGQPQRMEFWGKKADGTIFPKDLSLAPGKYFGQRAVIAVARDISEQKRAEEEREKLQTQLIQAQKMDSVGRLAGGVAHDFNNMLNVILGHADLALDRLSPDHAVHADLNEIRKAAGRSADLTRQLLAFARKQTVIPKVVSLNDLVGGMLKMLQRPIGEDIKLSWSPGSDLWPVKIDPSQIDQILANLCVNARDAISGAGKVSIATGNAVLDDEFCLQHQGFVQGDYVVLSVVDNGSGMEPETMDKLFEPFFTTKEIGKGTGLGLATVYGVVKQNNGFINVESQKEKGTVFTIYLPRHDGVVETPHIEQSLQANGKVHETVLVVEDEPMILNMTRLMLERLGYNVIAADDPVKALKIADDHIGEIHLLMTDVIMPEMNGRELAEKIVARFPGIKNLYMSGYTANVIAQHGVLDESVHFIQKPFSLYSLVAKLRDVISAR